MLPKSKSEKKKALKWLGIGMGTGLVFEWFIPEQYNPLKYIKGMFNGITGGN